MAQILITRARYGTALLWPGTAVDAASFDLALLTASGARLLASSALLLEASARASLVRARGGPIEEAEAVMLEAASRAEAANASNGAVTPSVHLPIQFNDAFLYVGSRLGVDYELGSVSLVATQSVLASDTNYWSFEAAYYDAAGAYHVLATGSTQLTGGVGNLDPGKAVSLGGSPATVPAGSVFAFTATSTASPDQSGFSAYFVPA